VGGVNLNSCQLALEHNNEIAAVKYNQQFSVLYSYLAAAEEIAVVQVKLITSSSAKIIQM
jgi:hypothetical protein